jgi:hypothetical protein
MLKTFYLVAGILSFLNGGWMLLYPLSWYEKFPSGIPHTGPYNAHFIRDLGIVYLIVALTFVWVSRNVRSARVPHFALTLFFVGHALLHLVDIVSGGLPPNHWLIDLPGVFLPGLLMAVLAVPSVRDRLS